MTKTYKTTMQPKQIHLDNAIALLNRDINRGVDFPEALYRASQATGVNYKLLTATYGAQFATFH